MVEYVQYLGEMDIFNKWVKKILFLYNSTKSIKIFQSYGHKCTATFYGLQCICYIYGTDNNINKLNEYE